MPTERFQTRIAVFVIVRNDKGEVLLQQRAPDSYLGGYWDFPSGHGEPGESIQESACRELKEEMDLDSKPSDMRLVHIDQYFVEVDYVNFVFALDAWSGEPRLCEPDSCSDVAWFKLDALPEKCVNVVRAVEAAGFTDELTYSLTDAKVFYDLMGMPQQKARKS